MQPRSSRFSPHLVAPEQLERLLVGRHALLRTIVDGFVGTLLEGGARYEVLAGPRGAGKSHLVALCASSLRKEERLKERMIVVSLDEEEHVGSLLDLLSRVLRSMPPEEGQIDPSELALSLRKTPGITGEVRATTFIRERLGKRALVLVLENLDRLFEALGNTGQKRFRALLHEEGCWSILATSQALGAAFHDRDRPFYRMFIERGIPAMDPEECREMLRRLADAHDSDDLARALSGGSGLSRVRSIHHLLGGNPRAMACLFPYLTTATLDNLESAFLDLADDLTPYYQEQMRARSAGQQAILEQLAESWHPLSVTELAEATFSAQGTTAGQLRYLAEDRLVCASAVGKERFYEISDPLWRLARAMKRPDQVGRVFVRFLKHWHTRGEIEEQRARTEGQEKAMWEAVRELISRSPAEGTPWEKAIQGEIEEARKKRDKEEGLRLARLYYEKSPGPKSGIELQLALFEKRAFKAFAEFSLEAVDRYGSHAAWFPFALAIRRPHLLPTDLVQRLRQEVSQAPSSVVGWRAFVDQLLLMDGESPHEVLADCALRTTQAIRSSSGTALFPGFLRNLSHFVGPSEVVAVAEKMAFKNEEDWYVFLDALWSLERKEEARKILESARESIQGTFEKEAFIYLFKSMHGLESEVQAALECGEEEKAVAATVIHFSNTLADDLLSSKDVIDVLTENPASALMFTSAHFHGWRIESAALLAARLPINCPDRRPLSFVDRILCGPSPRHTAFAALMASAELPRLKEALPSYLPAEHHAFGIALVDTLEGGSPSLPLDRVPGSFGSILVGWTLRLLADEARGIRGPERLARLLGPSPSDDLVAALTTALWQVALAAAVFGRPKDGIGRLLDHFALVAPERTPRDLVLAALALPDKVRPFARLAAPEREAFRQALSEMGPPGRLLLERLPTTDPA